MRNASCVERANGAERRQDGRKVFETSAFSKDGHARNAMSGFVGLRGNFCWIVRT